ncbi:winged helix-turn-helix domain-containing protein [Jiangella endophytica]|uniref:winged helix-turn-helix domain-containing protein n=1 Tax=Jiangella endophytica TaxID=1623398 RepID=UPI001300250E|nr:winged helix-turn-helix domain-containing protein [Jiangella endophytica]
MSPLHPIGTAEPSPLGLVVFVEVDEALAGRSGTTVVELAELLREFAQELLPTAETSAAIALRSPSHAGAQLRAVKAAIAEPEREPQAGSGFQLDHAARTAVVDGRAVTLTHREFELLAYLIENRRRAVTRPELIDHVWPLGTRAGSRTVDVHIRRLRVKLGPHGRRIHTLRGHGYRLD